MMVGIPTNFTKDPVATAHALINEPDTPISKVLSTLVPPPLEFIPHVDDPRATVGTWVRYNAMVQDIWDTELFVASSPDGKSGLLVENAAASDHAQAALCERLPVYLVSRPGQSKWTLPDRVEPNVVPKLASSLGGQKRPRESDDQMSDAGPISQDTTSPSATVGSSATPANADQASSKRHCADGMAGSVLVPSMGLNLPVHNQLGASAIVAKLYDTATGRDLKINSMVEVIGVLQNALQFSTDEVMENGDGLQNEILARNPANVKRLHVVSWREMKSWELNPLTKALGPERIVEARKEAQSLAGGLRDLLVRYFASALYNDLLAAEYLVMCLLSRPIRTRGDNVLGKLSVNIVLPSDCATSAVQELQSAVKEVLPTVVEIEVNLSSLNATEVYPRKDYDMNRLKAGALQMAAGTCLITNECNMTNGRLGERGVKNIKALSNVSQRCSMPIEFVYYESEIGVDCCTVLLSKGGKSVVPADVVVRVNPNPGLQLQKWDTYNPDLVRKLRLALALFAEDGVFDISPETTQDVEKAYVEARRRGAAKDGQDTLQKWLGVARAGARLHGESVLTRQRWRYALDLEQKREQRGRS